jgi:putative transposase
MITLVIEHSHLPHLSSFSAQPVVFLTAVTHARRPVLANAAAFGTLTALWNKSAELEGWFVGDYLLMLDHVHLFARAAPDAKSLGGWIGAWKSVSTRMLKRTAQFQSPMSQSDYFDRFVRSSENYRDKWNYVAMNPVRRGLCSSPEDWPWKGRLFDLTF